MGSIVHDYPALMLAALEIHESLSRRSGRTTAMIENLQPGDRVVVPSEQTKRFIENAIKEAGKDNVTVVVLRDSPFEHDYRPLRPIAGRTFFEHTWVLGYYRREVKHSLEALEAFNNHLRLPPESQPQPTLRQGLSGWSDEL